MASSNTVISTLFPSKLLFRGDPLEINGRITVKAGQYRELKESGNSKNKDMLPVQFENAGEGRPGHSLMIL